MAFIEMPISFKRQYNSSLVEDEVFASAKKRMDYLSSGLAYAGQIVAQSDDASVYVVNSTVDGYIKLGSSADISFKIVTDYNSLPKGGDMPPAARCITDTRRLLHAKHRHQPSLRQIRRPATDAGGRGRGLRPLPPQHPVLSILRQWPRRHHRGHTAGYAGHAATHRPGAEILHRLFRRRVPHRHYGSHPRLPR